MAYRMIDCQPRVACMLLTCVMLSASVVAQTAPTSQPDSDDATSLVERQRIIKDRVARLEDRMFQLSQALRKSDPEKAAQLMQSLSATRGLLVRQKMDEIAKKLEQSKLADANDAQKEVSADLQALLKMLLEGPDKLDERKKEIERLEAVQKQLQAVIQRQQEAKNNADAAAGKGEESLLEQIARIGKLIQRQQDLSNRTAKGGDPAALAEEQGQIREEADEIAGQLQSSESAGSAATTPEAAQAAEAMGQAGAQMDAAQAELQEKTPERAAGHQKQAEEQLAQAMELLKKRAKDDAATRKTNSPIEKQSAEQKEITKETKKLGKRMQGSKGGNPADAGAPEGGQPGEGGEQKSPEGGDGQKPQGGQQKSGEKKESGQSGGESSENGEQSDDKPTPGGEQVQEAVPFQEEAEKQLDNKDPSKASESQKKALEKLSQAKEELDKTLEQLRKEQQEELLAALENRFRAMLAKQLEVNKSTNQLDQLGAANWRRTDQLQLAELSQKQSWVGEEAEKALYILKEEGTTVVFPQVVEHLRDDAQDVSKRLTAAETGSSVQSVQEAIAQTLRELIEAIEKKQQENESQSGEGQQEQQDQNEPLLPQSAELKLLRSLQLRVNEATVQLEKDRIATPDKTDELEARRKKLATRQDQVHEMAKSMHEALRKAQ